MNLLDRAKNLIPGRHKTDSEGVIIACYFNPQRNPYREKAFRLFYNQIKHLPHRIIELVIGEVGNQLPNNKYIKTMKTEDLLWHKEGLLNILVSELPAQFKYVFWLDTDLLFQDDRWFINGIQALKEQYTIIQPFEYCIHLNRGDLKPKFSPYKLEYAIRNSDSAAAQVAKDLRMWRSFAANCADNWERKFSPIYDMHGHVGFAWGARREVLEAVPLYDRALTGGADHIIAHAAAGQVNHRCIAKSFTDDIDAVNDWSLRFYNATKGKIGYVKGAVYHIWHGAIEKRNYLDRIKNFTPHAKNIHERDKNGLYSSKSGHNEIVEYFKNREIIGNEADNMFLMNAMDNIARMEEEIPSVTEGDVLQEQYFNFGGGNFGGAGAEGSYGPDESKETFS